MALQQIPPPRLLLYGALILALLPAALLYRLWDLSSYVEALSSQLQEIEQQLFLKERRESANLALAEALSDADPFYLEKQVETISLLDREVEALQKAMKEKKLPLDELTLKRLEQLTGKNRIAFSESNVKQYPAYQEMIESLTTPVEVDQSDIGQLLAAIEGVQIGPYGARPKRPQLIILDFKIEKRRDSGENSTYLLNLKLLKREFSP